MVDKKDAHARKGIFMIDASQGFMKDGPKNRLRAQDIHKIVDVFNRRREIPKYSRMVSTDEIEKKEFNLNLPRYIDSQQPEDRQDIEGHLKGGIPIADVDALQFYWTICPQLRGVLFKANRPGYLDLAVDKAAIKSTIYEHPEFVAFIESMNSWFAEWRQKNAQRLRRLKINGHPKDVIAELSEDLLGHYEGKPLIESYDDYQVALLFMLGLDWKIASEWQRVRDQEKTLAELKKAAGAGAFGSIIGKAADLRTELTVAEDALRKLESQIATFRVLQQYHELEAEADQLTQKLNDLTNANVIDAATINDLERATESEAPPQLSELERIYAEAGVTLPGVAIKRYGEVRNFHESIIQNRRDYLTGELEAAKQRVSEREPQKRSIDERRATVMAILKTHGALDQFSKLQEEVARHRVEVESLRQRFGAAEQLEGTKTELDIERNRLTLRLMRDFTEQRERLSEAILAFEETSKRLYESAGRMTVEPTTNGPVFQFPMQGSRSKGIKNMQIFCFDMMLMRLCAKRGFGPGFLVHDSHLFDGVDGRQIISAMKVGAETAEELNFQYIVTMNEDDAFKETIDGFDLKKYVLPVVLTDAKEDGGLFGFRFG